MCHRGLQKQDLYVDKYFLDILNKADVCTLPAAHPPLHWGRSEARVTLQNPSMDFRDCSVLENSKVL